MNEEKTILEGKKNRWLAYIMGIGLVMVVIHNSAQPLIEYIFLPQLGFIIIIGCVYTILSKVGWRNITLGPKWFWIPMAVISGSMVLRLAVERDMHGVATAIIGVAFFGVYLASRYLGKDIFKVLGIAVVIEAISCVAYGIAYPGMRAGGIIVSPPEYWSPNYDIAIGFMIFGAIVFAFKRQWIIVLIALVGLFFTGAQEALFTVGILGIIVLARRDWNRKLLASAVTLLALIGICQFAGFTQQLYTPTFSMLYRLKALTVSPIPASQLPSQDDSPITQPPEQFAPNPRVPYHPEMTDRENYLNNISNDRYWQYKTAVAEMSPLGHGYEMTKFNKRTVHNVPLIIADQIGPVAAVAWLFIMVFGLIKTRWKYGFACVLTLGVLDHFIWTQIAPYWWVLAGVATAVPNIKSDLIFKEVRDGIEKENYKRRD